MLSGNFLRKKYVDRNILLCYNCINTTNTDDTHVWVVNMGAYFMSAMWNGKKDILGDCETHEFRR